MMSLRAKGLLCMILSNVDEWVVTKAWVAANCTEGRDAIRSAFNELVELGYASVEEQDQMDDGKFAKQIWTFRDEPAAVRKPAKITPNFGHIDPKSAENPQSPSDDRVRESAQNSPKSAENRIRKPAQKGPKSAENRQREPVNGNPPTKNTIEEDHKETESGDAAKARTRNELADHLAKVCGSDISRMTDGEWKPMRAGAHHPAVCPGGAYQGPQGYIMILCTQGQMPGLWNAIGRPDLAEDPRFVNNATRLEHVDEFVEVVESWMATFATDEEVIAALEAEQIGRAHV